MDNFLINIVSEGNIAKVMALAFGGHKRVVGYAIRDAFKGEPRDAEKLLKDPRDKYALTWQREPKNRRLVFFWAKTDSPDFVAFPFEMDSDGAADFATRWLDSEDYGIGPDHDGDNGKGWRLYCEGWGHVDDEWQAFVAVSPRWAMYGK